ncbi:MAG: hypothetical protein ACTSW1_05595 [Candidatus Hodarchaeales archaeon]
MTNSLLQLSAVIALAGFVIIAFISAIKFLSFYFKYREESLFHLVMISLGMVVYFVILDSMLVYNDLQLIDFIIKHFVTIVFTLLCLELSLFYLTIFSNRKNLWEKYIPFLYGISFGFFIALLGISDAVFFLWLVVLTFSISVIPTSIMAVRILYRIIPLVIKKESDLTLEDKKFMIILLAASSLLFGGSLIDVLAYFIILNLGIEIWPVIADLTGLFLPIAFIASVIVIRYLARDLDEADIIHIMNILS